MKTWEFSFTIAGMFIISKQDSETLKSSTSGFVIPVSDEAKQNKVE